jgi:hypothetical protein
MPRRVSRRNGAAGNENGVAFAQERSRERHPVGWQPVR